MIKANGWLIFLLSLLSLAVIVLIGIDISKDKAIASLRSDLLKSQTVTVLQHNENEALEERLAELKKLP